MFEQGQFALEITDLSGKIPINQLVDKGGKENKKQRDLLTRFLGSEPFELDPENVDNLLDAIKDWIDPDDEVTRFGAENGYYQGLERPYKCKNGPFEFLEQLLLVRGITNELFYGSEKTPGLSQYLTVHSEGKININTADPMVLKSLSPEMDWAAVENMVEYRLDKDNDLKNITWYKKAHGLDLINIDSDLVTTTSTHFEIISQGFKGEMEKILTAVVKRDKGTVKILSWKIE
jgi:general secretion pathway protein K